MEKRDQEIVVTHIKYEKTSCYFCNEWLDTDGFANHITQCGQVLEQCPNHCNAYIQRRKIETHLKTCPKSPQTSIQSESINGIGHINDNSGNRFLILEQDILSLRSALNEEVQQRHRLITDIGSLRKHNIVSDEWTQKVGDVLNALKKCLNEESEIRTVDIEQLKVDIGRLMYHYKQLDESRLEMRTKFDEFERNIIRDENLRRHVDVLIQDNRISASKIKNFESDFANLKLSQFDSTSDESLSQRLLSIHEILENHQEQIT